MALNRGARLGVRRAEFGPGLVGGLVTRGSIRKILEPRDIPIMPMRSWRLRGGWFFLFFHRVGRGVLCCVGCHAVSDAGFDQPKCVAAELALPVVCD